MESKQYNILFESKVIDGVDRLEARSNLQRLLNIDSSTVEGLFSVKRRTLKRNTTADVVRRYRAALRMAGVECVIEAAAGRDGPGREPAAVRRDAAQFYRMPGGLLLARRPSFQRMKGIAVIEAGRESPPTVTARSAASSATELLTRPIAIFLPRRGE